jgi:hypothetical protein
MLIYKLAPDFDKIINYPVERSPFWETGSFLDKKFLAFMQHEVSLLFTRARYLSQHWARLISASFIFSQRCGRDFLGIDAASYLRRTETNPVETLYLISLRSVVIQHSYVYSHHLSNAWVVTGTEYGVLGKTALARTYGKNRGSWTRTLLDPHFSRVKYIFGYY